MIEQFIAQFDWAALLAAAALVSLLVAIAVSDDCFEETPTEKEEEQEERLTVFQRYLTEVEVLKGRDLSDAENFEAWDAWCKKRTPNEFAEGLA